MSLLPVNVSEGVYLDCVLFPLTFKELLDTIEKIGYVLHPSIPKTRALGRFRGSGQIGTKGKNIFQVEGGDKALLVVGASLVEVQSEFAAFCKTLVEDFSIDVEEMIKFYQFTGNYEYKTEHNPYDVISRSFVSPHQEKVSEILGMPLKTYAVRIATSESLPKDVDWFDMKISPDVQRNDGYTIETVYRNKNKEQYTNFTDSFESNIVSLIKYLEGK